MSIYYMSNPFRVRPYLDSKTIIEQYYHPSHIWDPVNILISGQKERLVSLWNKLACLFLHHHLKRNRLQISLLKWQIRNQLHFRQSTTRELKNIKHFRNLEGIIICHMMGSIKKWINNIIKGIESTQCSMTSTKLKTKC